MDKNKVLIIEDEAAMRDSLRDVLEMEGYEVETADDGEKGIELINEFVPDLILLDIILPKKDGFEVLKEIKDGNKDDKVDIPVVLLTNISGMENVQKALDLGATTYLVKAEYQLDEVIGKVKELIG